MAESIARSFFPKLYSKLEKRKQAAGEAPLSINDISTLLTMQINGKPLYQSIEEFYSDEFKQQSKNGATSATGTENIPRYRRPTEKELNMLYCDIHAREDAMNYSGNNQPDS